MKTNKTTQPARNIHAPRPTRHKLGSDQPHPHDYDRPAQQNDFLALCFYPGMKAVELPLSSYPTAV